MDQNRGTGGPPAGPGYPPTQGQNFTLQNYCQNQGNSQSDHGYTPTEGQNYNQQAYGYGQGNPQQNQGYPPPVAVAHPGGPNYPAEAVANGEKKKKDSHLGVLAAGAGGLLVGGLAGAALSRRSSHNSHNEGKCSAD